MANPISRRRAISICAAACGLPLLGLASTSHAGVEPVIWKGQALGAPATLILNHPDRNKAQQLIQRVVLEVQRLEAIFSLYRKDSALNELNRFGALAMPPEELVAVLEASRAVWEETTGLFDPTVQPLWALYAHHFARPDAQPSGPPSADLDEVRALIGFQNVRFNRDRISFENRGMALTLNGIAQGYVTDRIVAMLRDAGITSSLVDMGESRAIGRRADGSPWQIGLAETQGGDPADAVIPLIDKAVATSSFSGFRFDAPGRFSHILDPHRGSVTPMYRRLTTITTDATRADAYSTAMSLMDLDQIRATIALGSGIAVDLVTETGDQLRLG